MSTSTRIGFVVATLLFRSFTRGAWVVSFAGELIEDGESPFRVTVEYDDAGQGCPSHPQAAPHGSLEHVALDTNADARIFERPLNQGSFNAVFHPTEFDKFCIVHG
jgi:hypothetical protein